MELESLISIMRIDFFVQRNRMRSTNKDVSLYATLRFYYKRLYIPLTFVQVYCNSLFRCFVQFYSTFFFSFPIHRIDVTVNITKYL